MSTSANTYIDYDIIIIGGGPAGMAAATYAARERMRVLVLEKAFYGGQISITNLVENYPGVVSTTGPDLSTALRTQAESFGAEFVNAEVERIDIDTHDPASQPVKTVVTEDASYRCLSVILATGANPRGAGFDGEESFKGRGVSYCATCDAMFYQGKDVFVVGGGLSACEESVYLTNVVKSVTMIVRKDHLRAAAGVAQHVYDNPKISVRYNTKIDKVEGLFGIEKITFSDTVNGESSEHICEPGSVGIFVFTGYVPEIDLVRHWVDLDDMGAIITADDMSTSVPGLYVAGDVRSKQLRQLVTATSDGAIAATSAGRWVQDIRYRHPEIAFAAGGELR